MQFKTIFRVLGLLLMFFSLSMLPPIGIDFLYQEHTHQPFVTAFGLTLITGFILWFPTRAITEGLKTRDGFVIVSLLWIVLSLFGALPLMLTPHLHESFTDAFFEATSGLTTTGATVISGLDYLSHAVRFYRQELQFLGGMGMIVLAVAVLPMLGIGGMQLYRAEIPGPIKDSKLTPRITETAKALWYIYVGLTLACMIGYWAAGMTFFDAVGESFATVATGGFSMHDKSFAFYQSSTVELVATFFMFMGGTNFALHFISFKRLSLSQYWADLEFRTYVALLFGTVSVIALGLVIFKVYPPNGTVLVKSLFNVVSLATTTGFESAAFERWPSYLPYLIMFVALVGGCAGSTSGGMKILRIALLQKQGVREMKRLIHPQAVIPLKFGRQILPEPVIQSMWAFIAIFSLMFVVMLLMLLATGIDFTTGFGALTACFANAGNGIGHIAGNFVHLTLTEKWILIFAMFAGRLEIFTLLVLLMPSFWRR